ncbi:hypothetical protein HUN01_10050 [Nostoc edaphicum CCNP1411]|uniref:Uncharacterized protein n=1 Tax=Nostoc edaphicum CCNP1411 TaxID=1472755 RepID=A0A7D7LDM3_9NOSO|nr:hypothetical protein [Nostoc edaphicum]QMS87912.1 hypothetical protein HUN01_10050 [Nostoc edaphicum CCNP1411]
MAENSEKTTDLDLSSSEDLEKIPLLPRSAWNSQLAYLKVLLKAKQVLDKSIQFR